MSEIQELYAGLYSCSHKKVKLEKRGVWYCALLTQKRVTNIRRCPVLRIGSSKMFVQFKKVVVKRDTLGGMQRYSFYSKKSSRPDLGSRKTRTIRIASRFATLSTKYIGKVVR